MSQSTSDVGDLSDLCEDLHDVFEEYGFEDPALAVAFNTSEDRRVAHYVTNTTERGAHTILLGALRQLQDQ